MDFNNFKSVGAAEFAQYAKHLMLGKGDLLSASATATAGEGRGVFPRVASAMKAAVAYGSTSDATWAGNVADISIMSDSFAQSLRGVSVFDTVAGQSWRASLQTRVAAETTAASAGVVGEGMPVPVTTMAFSSNPLKPLKVQTLCVVSDDLLRGPFAERFLDAELSGAVATATDAVFVSGVIAGASSSATAGTGPANALKDLATLLGKVNLPGSVPLLILGSANANALSLAEGSQFREATPMGGTVAGIPFLVSAAAPTKAILVDARALLTASDTVVLDASQEATIQLDNAPDNPADASTVLVSLWQANMTGLLATRHIGFQVIRAAGIAVISGAAW